MGTLDSLGLKDEVLPVVPPEEIPEEFSAAPPPPYPGVYLWKLDADLSNIWNEPMKVKVDENGIQDREGSKDSERLSGTFDLEIMGSDHGLHIGEAFSTRINTAERNRARKGEPPRHVSDMTYLLQALGDPNPNPGSNKGFGEAVQRHPGQQFKSNLEWTARCSLERQAYYEQEDEAGNSSLQPAVEEDGTTPTNGCGNRYYMNDWPKDESGRYKERKVCTCGASLRPFGQLRNFKPAS